MTVAERIFELAKERWLEDHDTGLRGLCYAIEDENEWRAYVTAAAVDIAREENEGA